jgi:hypothetical protein
MMAALHRIGPDAMLAERSQPPKTLMALLDRILGDPARTRRAVCLMVAGAVALAVALGPLLLVVSLFGPTGAAAVGGVGALTTTAVAARRALAARRSTEAAMRRQPRSPRVDK